MAQKTIQINIEEQFNGIQSFEVYQIRYKNKGDDDWHFWLTYFNIKRARYAVKILESLPEVNFACIDSVRVFI